MRGAAQPLPVTGTRKGNRTYFEDNKGRRWMMIEEDGQTTVMPR